MRFCAAIEHTRAQTNVSVEDDDNETVNLISCNSSIFQMIHDDKIKDATNKVY